MSAVKYKVRFKVISFNRDKYMADYQKGMMNLMIRAARAFALAASSKIPVDTGMAKSTLLGQVIEILGGYSTASDYLGLSDSPSSIDVASQIQRTRKGLDKSKYWKNMFPGITDDYKRTPSAGRKRGLFEFRIVGSKIVFSFFPSVRHYLYWEGRWRSMDVGRKAFRNFVELNHRKYIPKINKYYKMSYRSA